MSAADTPATAHATAPAWLALFRAELARLGLPDDEAAAALADLRGVGALVSVATAQQAAPLHLPPQPSALSPQPSWRWGDHTLTLGTRTLIMGVINVTDDSLSADGLGRDLGAVVARAEALVADGADVLDVGGESTRPGAPAVPAPEERARVEPAVAAIARRLAVPISVDTRRAAVAEAALAAGAGAVNDVSGLRHDRAVAAVTARAGAALILGHWVPRPGRPPQRRLQYFASHPHPGTSQGTASPVASVTAGLQESVGWALIDGCTRDQLAVDPGLGFGKAPRVSLVLLRDLGALRTLGLPVVVGPSRKGFIGRVLGPAEQHGWEGTAAAVALAIAGGADIVRVHDVVRLVRVVRMSDAIVRAMSHE